jgi:hypothetical protein
MKSVGTMIKQLGGLTDTHDLNDWENLFVLDMCEKTQDGKITATLSEKQVITIERIYDKYFA